MCPQSRARRFWVNPNLTPSLDERFAKAEAAAKSPGITLRRVNAANPADLNTALPVIQASSSEALLVQNDPMLGPERSRISDFAVAHRLPTVFEGPGCGSVRLGLLRAEREARGEVPQSVQPTWAPGSMEWQAEQEKLKAEREKLTGGGSGG